ncbi:MAG: hypothetical protein K6G48_05855 [Acholeplasmatales bacterium]|nr:hypothetical protein [Acholeplasmatales bacterium]
MKRIDFTVVDTKGTDLKMVLVLDDGDKPYIEYNDQKYIGAKPKEVLEGEMIKNPQPLPNDTYGFIVDDLVILYQHGLLTGNNFMVLNPGYATKDYKGKNRIDKIAKWAFGILLVIIAVVAILLYV